MIYSLKITPYAILKSLCLVVLMVGLIALNPIELYSHFPDSHRYSEAKVCYTTSSVCDAALETQNVSLPHFISGHMSDQRHTAIFQINLDDLEAPIRKDATIGIFLPKFSSSINLRVNGVTLTAFDLLSKPRFGNVVQYEDRPYYTTFPTDLLNTSSNTLEVELSAYNYAALSLFPVYIGDTLQLRIRYHIRQFIRIVMPQISFVFVALVSILILSLWFARRHEREYLWMASAGFCMLIPCLNFFTPLAPLPDHLWIRVTALSLLGIIYFCLRYVLSHFKIDRSPYWKFVHLILILSTVILFAMPNTYIGPFFLVYHVSIGLIALYLPVLSFSNAEKPEDLGQTHGLLFSFVLALCIVDLIYAIWGPAFTVFQPAYLAPLFLMLGAMALIFQRLAISIRGLETLNDEMAETIRVKSSEIAAFEKQKAIREERKRITLDLHDGVGGQISNVLAYMENSQKSDEVVISNLEYAMRDMALIIDSLEGEQDIGQLLGSFRDRIAPLLSKAGMALHWEVEESPQLTSSGSSAALNIIRIVQEAFVNAVKHSRAKNITLQTRSNRIEIIDDGNGFDVTAPRSKHGANSGIGLEGIKNRSRALEIGCEVQSGSNGTHIKLSW